MDGMGYDDDDAIIGGPVAVALALALALHHRCQRRVETGRFLIFLVGDPSKQVDNPDECCGCSSSGPFVSRMGISCVANACAHGSLQPGVAENAIQ